MEYSINSKNGFTLIEIIIAIVVIAITMGIGSLVISNIMRSYHLVTTRKELLFNGRVAINRMIREIRHIEKINVKEANRLKFSANINNSSNDIDYKLKSTDTTKLMRNNDILANYLKNLKFEYYKDSDKNIAVSNEEVKYVKINIALEDIHYEQTLYLESEARIRNKE